MPLIYQWKVHGIQPSNTRIDDKIWVLNFNRSTVIWVTIDPSPSFVAGKKKEGISRVRFEDLLINFSMRN